MARQMKTWVVLHSFDHVELKAIAASSFHPTYCCFAFCFFFNWTKDNLTVPFFTFRSKLRKKIRNLSVPAPICFHVSLFLLLSPAKQTNKQIKVRFISFSRHQGNFNLLSHPLSLLLSQIKLLKTNLSIFALIEIERKSLLFVLDLVTHATDTAKR